MRYTQLLGKSDLNSESRVRLHKRYAKATTNGACSVVNLKGAKSEVRKALALLAIAFVATGFFSPFPHVKAETATEHSEYQQYVHTYVNSTKGNWTSVEKPMFPVLFNESQIGIGANWSIVEPLLANHSYHVYCYGAWVNNGSTPKTDYDIYVYNPKGIQESEHTEAAGLPEHLGTRVNDTFFTPATSGNYTFVIANDARQSNGTQQATFMAIENLEPDHWYTRYIEGKSHENSAFSTSWAYEFVTESPRVEIYVKVPDTLDMYEARLYLMSNPQSLIVNDAPLPWEPGLFGNLTGNVGGYSLDSEEYRGVAFSSCEYRGQDMLLNYSATSTGKTLFHLALIGEFGSGNVEFLVKTQFTGASLVPSKYPIAVYPTNQTTVSYISNSTDLNNAVIEYSLDDWNNTVSTPMKIENRTCSAILPPQKAGSVVEYRVTADDVLMNVLSANGSYVVKQSAMLNITAVKETVRIGENITITGTLTGPNGTVPITAQLMSANETLEAETTTLENGTFTINFQPNSTGVWVAQATFAGSNAIYGSDSNPLMIKVEEAPFIVKNGIFIGGGFIGAIAVGGVVFFIRKRRQ